MSNKYKLSARIDPGINEVIDHLISINDFLHNKTDFVEKAVLHYISYLKMQKSDLHILTMAMIEIGERHDLSPAILDLLRERLHASGLPGSQ